MICNNCNNEVSDNSEVCINCGNNLLVPDYTKVGIKTGEIKETAKSLVHNGRVKYKSLYVLYMLIPLIILSFMSSILSKHLGNNLLVKYILSILVAIVLCLFSSVLSIKIINTIRTGKANLKFKFNKRIYLIVLIVTVFMYTIQAIFSWLTLKGFGPINSVWHALVIYVITLIELYIALLTNMIIYMVISRNYKLVDATKVVLTMNGKDYWNILKLLISFIPLLILILLTSGILIIWKGYYIPTCYNILFEKLLMDRGI